jgi:hypothetical protein
MSIRLSTTQFVTFTSLCALSCLLGSGAVSAVLQPGIAHAAPPAPIQAGNNPSQPTTAGPQAQSAGTSVIVVPPTGLKFVTKGPNGSETTLATMGGPNLNGTFAVLADGRMTGVGKADAEMANPLSATNRKIGDMEVRIRNAEAMKPRLDATEATANSIKNHTLIKKMNWGFVNKDGLATMGTTGNPMVPFTTDMR